MVVHEKKYLRLNLNNQYSHIGRAAVNICVFVLHTKICSLVILNSKQRITTVSRNRLPKVHMCHSLQYDVCYYCSGKFLFERNAKYILRRFVCIRYLSRLRHGAKEMVPQTVQKRYYQFSTTRCYVIP